MKTQMTPIMYDGTTNPTVFVEYFRLQAVYQEWDNAKQCLVLPMFLRGAAKKVFTAFNPKNNIDDLLAEIVDKCTQPQEFLLNEFFQRKQQIGETISKFALALEALLQAADPTMPVANQTKLLKAQLSNSLPDHTRELINFNSAMTWPELLRNLDKSTPRVASIETKLPLIKAEPADINWLTSQPSYNRPSYPTSAPYSNQNKFNGNCHYCNNFSHRESECRIKDRANQFSSTRFSYNRNNNNNVSNRGGNNRTATFKYGNHNTNNYGSQRFNNRAKLKFGSFRSISICLLYDNYNNLFYKLQ